MVRAAFITMLRAQFVSLLERTLPVLRPAMGKNADALYGSNWAVVAVDADGRLLHCGRGLAGAMAAIERVLPAGETGK